MREDSQFSLWAKFVGIPVLAVALAGSVLWYNKHVKPVIPDRQQECANVEESPVEKIIIKDEPKSLEALLQPEVDKASGLVYVEKWGSIQFYGIRVTKDKKYRRLDRDLYDLLGSMAHAYKAKFNQPLYVGPMWDDQGHSANSKHYKGLALDIDFGANVGTEQYKNSDRKKAEFLLLQIKEYSMKNKKSFKVLFNDPEFIDKGLCSFYQGHHNHIHIGK
jgi:hypothetical protein